MESDEIITDAPYGKVMWVNITILTIVVGIIIVSINILKKNNVETMDIIWLDDTLYFMPVNPIYPQETDSIIIDFNNMIILKEDLQVLENIESSNEYLYVLKLDEDKLKVFGKHNKRVQGMIYRQ
jgi:hypothetical protein